MQSRTPNIQQTMLTAPSILVNCDIFFLNRSDMNEVGVLMTRQFANIDNWLYYNKLGDKNKVY